MRIGYLAGAVILLVTILLAAFAGAFPFPLWFGLLSGLLPLVLPGRPWAYLAAVGIAFVAGVFLVIGGSGFLYLPGIALLIVAAWQTRGRTRSATLPAE